MHDQSHGPLSQRVIERAHEQGTAAGSQSGIGQQIAQRPWVSVGLALAAGYLLGGSSAPAARAKSPSYTPVPARAPERPSQPDDAANLREHSAKPSSTDRSAPAGTGDADITHYPSGTPAAAAGIAGPASSQPRKDHSAGLGQLGDQISGEIDTLKGAAVSAVLDLLRGTVAQSLPGISREMERMRRERVARTDDTPAGAVFESPQYQRAFGSDR